MALTLDTISIPGKTIITDSITGGIAVISSAAEDSTSPEYTITNEIADKLTIIATHLESISNSLNNGSTPIGTILSELAQTSENSSASLAGILDRAQGVGIHMKGPQDWIGLISTYKLYVENEGPDKMTLAEFAEYFSKVDSLPKSF
jgi:hypothetical protein